MGDSPGKAGVLRANGPKQKRPKVSSGESPSGADELMDNSVTPGGIHAGGNTFGADSPAGGSSGGRGGFGTQVHESAGTMKFAGMGEDLSTSPFHSNPDSRKFPEKADQTPICDGHQGKELRTDDGSWGAQSPGKGLICQSEEQYYLGSVKGLSRS